MQPAPEPLKKGCYGQYVVVHLLHHVVYSAGGSTTKFLNAFSLFSPVEHNLSIGGIVKLKSIASLLFKIK